MTTTLTPEVLQELNEKINKAIECALNKGWKLDEAIWVGHPGSTKGKGCCCPLGAVIICHLDLTPEDPDWDLKTNKYSNDELAFVADLLGLEPFIVNDFAQGFDGEWEDPAEDTELYKLGLDYRKKFLGRDRDDPPEPEEDEPGEPFDDVDEDPDLP